MMTTTTPAPAEPAPNQPGAEPAASDSLALTVADLMTEVVVTLADYEDLSVAADIMAEGRIRHLPVVDDARVLLGLVTHRDLLRYSASAAESLSDDARRQQLKGLAIRDVMETDVSTVLPTTPLADAAKTIVGEKFGCLPVVDAERRVIGIVTESDFVSMTLRLLSMFG